MKNSANSVFQIPNYAQLETVREDLNKQKSPVRPIPQKEKPSNNEAILFDLLAKSQEITKARAEAAEFLRRMK